MKSRKMLRKMSTALACVMLLGSVSGFSAFAAENTKTVFTDNFESYADVTDLASVYSGWNERMSVGTEGDNKFIEVKLTSSDNNIQVDKSFGRTYTSGHLNVKYSVKPAEGITTLFYLTGNGSKEMPRFEGGKMYFDWSGIEIGTYTPGEWYDVDVDVDLNEQKYDISVQKQGSSETPVTYNDVPVGFTGVSGLKMQVWANADRVSCFDNIEITHTPAMPYEQDFESIDQSSLTMRSGAIGENGSIADGDNGSKVFDLKGTDSNGAPELQFGIGAINSGELVVEADMKTGSNTQSLILLRNGNDARQAVLLDCGRGIYSEWDKNMFTDTCAANTWYHITLNYNLDKGTMNAEVSDANGNVYVKNDYAFETALTTVKSINFQTWSKESTYIDNVKISHRTVPYDQDFESGNADGLVLTHDDSSVCGVVDVDGNKVYKLITAGEGPSLTKNLSEISDGKIYVDTDIYPGSSDVWAQIFATITKPDGSTDTKNLLGFNSPDGIRCGWGGDVYLSEYTPNTWYHVNMEIDVATGKMNTTISDGNGTTGTLTDQQIFDAGSVVNNIYFQLWKRDSETYAYLDNIKITDSSYMKFADTEVTNSSAKANVVVNDFEKLTDANSKVILTVYNEGRLLGVNTQPIADGSSTALEVNYNETDASAITLKAFLWNFNTLKPITECISK